MYDPATARWMSRDPRPGTEMGVVTGSNLYQYVESNPLNAVDPSGLESFYICQRDIGGGGGMGDATARSCGCQHQDIYGDQSGPIRIGFGGAAIGGGPGLPKGPGWKCTKLHRQNDVWGGNWWRKLRDKTIGYGPGAGKDCEKATSAEIAACIAAVPKPPGSSNMVSNCQTDIWNAADSCCLSAPPPLTIIPILPPIKPMP